MSKHTRRPINMALLFMLAVLVGLIAVLVVRINHINTPSTEPTPQPTPTIEHSSAAMVAPSTPQMPEPTPEPTPARIYYDVPLAEEYQDIIHDNLELFSIDLDIAWVLGIIYRESSFDSQAVSSHNAQGYLQMLQSTYEAMYSEVNTKYPELELVDDVFDTKTNLTCGMYYLRYMADIYGNGQVNGDTIHELLTRYHRGPSGGKSYYEKNGTWESSYSLLCEVAANHIRNNGNAVNIPNTY